jgi:hypothetical protein
MKSKATVHVKMKKGLCKQADRSNVHVYFRPKGTLLVMIFNYMQLYHQ